MPCLPIVWNETSVLAVFCPLRVRVYSGFHDALLLYLSRPLMRICQDGNGARQQRKCLQHVTKCERACSM